MQLSNIDLMYLIKFCVFRECKNDEHHVVGRPANNKSGDNKRGHPQGLHFGFPE